MALSIKPLSLAECAQLFAHLAAMETAGVPVTQSLNSLVLPVAAMGRVNQMQRLLEQGHDLASAGGRSGLFSPLDVSLVQAAQSAGSPARLYQRMAMQYAEQAKQAKAMRTRMFMPLGVLLLALLVQPLPSLVGGSLSGGAYLWGVLQPLIILYVLYLLARKLSVSAQQGGSGVLDNLRLATPLFGYAYKRRLNRDFFESLGLLLEAGVPMFDALPKACATLTNAQIRADFQALAARVTGGQPLAKALQSMDFPGRPQLASLVAMGEGSGTLPATLLSYAQRESQEVASFEEQLATWLPRLFYVVVALWMAYGIVTGGGFSPQLPADLL